MFSAPFIFDSFKDIDAANNKHEQENEDFINGSNILLCKKIAEKINKKIVVKVYSNIAGMTADLKNGQIDFMICCLNATNERKEKFLNLEYSLPKVSALIK